MIGERTAEQIKIEIGSAYALGRPITMEIKGRSLTEGVPKTVAEIFGSAAGILGTIVQP